jgi:hypothetical protein
MSTYDNRGRPISVEWAKIKYTIHPNNGLYLILRFNLNVGHFGLAKLMRVLFLPRYTISRAPYELSKYPCPLFNIFSSAT